VGFLTRMIFGYDFYEKWLKNKIFTTINSGLVARFRFDK
jgi:hypothetical protein